MSDQRSESPPDAPPDPKVAALVLECLQHAAAHLRSCELSLDASLTDDLALDSVQLMETLALLESRGGRVQATSGKPLQTVADLVRLIAV